MFLILLEEFIMKKLLLLFALLAIVGVAQAEMIVNGGFADSETDKAPWMSWGSGGGATWQVYYTSVATSGGAPDTTGNPGDDNFLKLGMTDAVATWGTWGWGYNVAFQGKTPDGQAPIPITPGMIGTSMTMSADYKSGVVSSGLLGFEWCNDSGTMVDFNGDGQVNDWDKQNIMVPFTADDTWQNVSVTVTVPNIPGLVQLIAVFGGAGNHGEQLGLDNVHLYPEPMSIALLGLGGLFLRRRK
jgi:hypothetical protein